MEWGCHGNIIRAIRGYFFQHIPSGNPQTMTELKSNHSMNQPRRIGIPNEGIQWSPQVLGSCLLIIREEGFQLLVLG